MKDNDDTKKGTGGPSSSDRKGSGEGIQQGRRRLLQAGLVAGPLFVSLYARSTFAGPMGSLGMYEYGDDQGEDEEENKDHHDDQEHDDKDWD